MFITHPSLGFHYITFFLSFCSYLSGNSLSTTFSVHFPLTSNYMLKTKFLRFSIVDILAIVKLNQTHGFNHHLYFQRLPTFYIQFRSLLSTLSSVSLLGCFLYSPFSPYLQVITKERVFYVLNISQIWLTFIATMTCKYKHNLLFGIL